MLRRVLPSPNSVGHQDCFNASNEERLKMMELLKRFEGSNAEETDSEGENEEEDTLVQSLGEADIGMEPHPQLTFFIGVLA